MSRIMGFHNGQGIDNMIIANRDTINNFYLSMYSPSNQ